MKIGLCVCGRRLCREDEKEGFYMVEIEDGAVLREEVVREWADFDVVISKGTSPALRTRYRETLFLKGDFSTVDQALRAYFTGRGTFAREV